MNLLSRTIHLHDEKLPGVLLQFIQEGRAQEVLQALPDLQSAHPSIVEKLRKVESEAQSTLSKHSKPKGFEPVKVDRCVHCGYSLRQYSPDSIVLICEACGTQSKGDKNYRHDISIPDHPLFKLHATFDYFGSKWQVIGCQTYRGVIREWDGEDDVWETNPWSYHSWWLMNDKREMAWIDHDKEGYSWSYETKVKGKPLKNDRQTEYGTYELICSVGEFSYFPKSGEQVKTFEKDEYSVEIILDRNGKKLEIEAFRARKLSRLDLLAAFGQLEVLARIRRLSFGLVAVCVSLLALAVGGLVLDLFEKDLVSFRTTPIRAVGEAKRIPFNIFSLRKSGLVKFQIVGDIPGDDGSFDAEFVVEDPDHVLVAEVPFSFWRESGRDSDGPWTENKKVSVSKILLPAGADYQLSLVPDKMINWKKVTVRGQIRQNSTSFLPKILGAIALLLVAISLYMARRQEIRRSTGIY